MAKKQGFTKKQLLSAQRIEEALRIIIALVPLENNRSSQKRRHDLAKAYASLTTHAYEFGVATPHLGYMYNENEYLAGALKIQPAILDKFVEIESGEQDRKIHAVHVRQ